MILLSAYHDPKLVERAEQDHVSGCLIKPIKAADLQPTIAIVMERFEELQRLKPDHADPSRQLNASDTPSRD